MTDHRQPQRRHRYKRSEEESPQPGYRQTRRSGKSGKKARKAERAGRVQQAVSRFVKQVGTAAAVTLAVVVGLMLVAGVLLVAAKGINAYARWSARRSAQEAAVTAAKQKSRENLLVVAVQDKQATGFLAMRVDAKGSRVLGIAIPEGAFMEVPGQGFERIGDSYKAGPAVSMSTVSNYLGVPFDSYVIVDDATYKAMMKKQEVSGLMAALTETNLGRSQRRSLATVLGSMQGKNVGLVSLPVRSVTIGNMTYFEPQRDQIADLLYSWWGVRFGSGKQAPRVIVYNGEGVPGIAGVAARELIKAGFRVVDTGNADRFDYAKTRIVLLRGQPGEAQRVRDILGTGEIVRKETDEDITDVVVIIGKDYKAPSK